MKRDLDLIRKMLLAMEEAPTGWAPDFKFAGYTDAQIGYHAYLIADAGLAVGSDATSMSSDGPVYLLGHLTWAGHEFVEAARDESRWKSAMVTVAKKGGSVTLDVLKEVLVALMRGAMGLPGA